MMPGILSTFVLMMVVGMRELTIPLMLYSPDNVVLPVMVIQLYQSGQTTESAAAALTLTSMCVSVVALVFVLRRRHFSPVELR
jgi:iron(III) transport system permease protein